MLFVKICAWTFFRLEGENSGAVEPGDLAGGPALSDRENTLDAATTITK